MKRRPIRTFLRALGLTLGVLFVLALAGSLALRVYGQRRLGKARSALAQEGVLLDPTSYESPRIPEAENAAVWFQAGAAAVVLSKEDRTFILASSRLPSQEWDEERTRRARALLAVNHGALETLHRGAALSRSSFELRYREGAATPIPDERALRNAAGLLVAEGRLALRDGDEGRLLLAERSVSHLADTMTREPILIMQVVGNFIEQQALSLASEVIVGPRDLQTALAGLGGALSTGDRLPELRRSFGCEAAMMSTLFDGGQLLDDSLLPDDTRRTLSVLNISGYARLTHATLLEALLYQRALIDAPIGTLLAEDPAPPTSPLQMHRWLAASLTPAARRAALAARLNLADRQLVGAAIVIRNAGLRQNAYPSKAPREAAASQPNALTGLPLRYTVDASGLARIEIPGVTAEQLGGSHMNPLLKLDLPVPRPARAPAAGR
jgi:hypothetical protein